MWTDPEPTARVWRSSSGATKDRNVMPCTCASSVTPVAGAFGATEDHNDKAKQPIRGGFGVVVGLLGDRGS